MGVRTSHHVVGVKRELHNVSGFCYANLDESFLAKRRKLLSNPLGILSTNHPVSEVSIGVLSRNHTAPPPSSGYTVRGFNRYSVESALSSNAPT